jgi:hypothetical protein
MKLLVIILNVARCLFFFSNTAFLNLDIFQSSVMCEEAILLRRVR